MARDMGYLFGVAVMFTFGFYTHATSYDLYKSCERSPIPVSAHDIAELLVEGNDPDTYECSVTFRTTEGEDLYYKFTEFSVARGNGEIKINSHFKYNGAQSHEDTFTDQYPPKLNDNKRADRYITVTVTRMLKDSSYTAKLEITNESYGKDANNGSLRPWVIALGVISCIVLVAMIVVLTVIFCKRRRRRAKEKARLRRGIFTITGTNTTTHTGYPLHNSQQMQFIPQAEQPIGYQSTNSVPQPQPPEYEAYPSSNPRPQLVPTAPPPPSYEDCWKTLV